MTDTDSHAGAAADSTLPVGYVIGGRYVIEKHISSGGFGAVYRATDREIVDHQVALKLLHQASASAAEREYALRELKLIATVSHPSVVQFKDYGWHEERLWFAMPWYQGQTLDRIIGNDETAVAMTRAEARPIFTRVAQGLAAMHAVGIHHHDIKPENIFVAEIAGFPGGLPILLDLGISTRRGENPKGLTVEYASPETAAAMLGVTDKPIGAAADVYSLALVLRNALDPSVATPVRTSEVLPLLHQRSTVPVGLSQKRELKYLEPSFRRWLSLNPDERPSAVELADQLAVLTEPEERRQAQLRLLKRVIPIVAIAALLIVGLVFQVRRQKSALQVQGQQLEQQLQTGAALREQSATQLAEIEEQAKTLGNERAQLTQTLTLARDLNKQLEQAGQREALLDRRVSKVTGERDQLEQEKQGLTTERDALTAERDRLKDDYNKLSRAQTELGRERDGLLNERDRLKAERDQAAAERDALDQRLASVSKERDRLVSERDSQIAKYELAVRARDESVAKNSELEQQIATLRSDNKKLEKRLSELEATPPPPPAPVEQVTRPVALDVGKNIRPKRTLKR